MGRLKNKSPGHEKKNYDDSLVQYSTYKRPPFIDKSIPIRIYNMRRYIVGNRLQVSYYYFVRIRLVSDSIAIGHRKSHGFTDDAGHGLIRSLYRNAIHDIITNKRNYNKLYRYCYCSVQSTMYCLRYVVIFYSTTLFLQTNGV